MFKTKYLISDGDKATLLIPVEGRETYKYEIDFNRRTIDVPTTSYFDGTEDEIDIIELKKVIIDFIYAFTSAIADEEIRKDVDAVTSANMSLLLGLYVIIMTESGYLVLDRNIYEVTLTHREFLIGAAKVLDSVCKELGLYQNPMTTSHCIEYTDSWEFAAEICKALDEIILAIKSQVSRLETIKSFVNKHPELKEQEN